MNKSIARAQVDEEDNDDSNRMMNADQGNNQLSLYATLLMPFWESNPAVPQLIGNLLKTSDRKLKYNTLILLMRNNRQVPDSMFRYFASLDAYRYDLYTDLKDMNALKYFPSAYNNPVELGKSRLLEENRYFRPDSIVFLEKLPLKIKQRTGYVYFFKYREKKNDNSWKLATVGLVPGTPGKFEYESSGDEREDASFDLTEMTDTRLEEDRPLKEQLQEVLKKKLYSKRNSAAQFYQGSNRMDFMRGLNFRD